MSFKTLEEMKDANRMRASLKRLRKTDRQTAFLFKISCDALGGKPLLWVAEPGRPLNAQLIKVVNRGSTSIRGTVCREDGELVFSTRSQVNTDKMARTIARIATQYSANIPLQRIKILTPKDNRPPKPTSGASAELEEKLRKRREASEPTAQRDTPSRQDAPPNAPAHPSPKERVQRLRQAAPRLVPTPEPEPALDMDVLRADLRSWQQKLATHADAEAKAKNKLANARSHLVELGQMVRDLLKQRDPLEIASGLEAIAQKDDDPELPQLIQRARKTENTQQLLVLIQDWFEDVGDEHNWEIESLRESADEKTAAREEMEQLIASVEALMIQSGSA